MAISNKFKTILNNWINTKKNDSKSRNFQILNDLSIGRKRAHQKMLEYELEILQGKVKKKYQEFGELIYGLMNKNKKILKSSKEIKSIILQIKEWIEEIEIKQKGKDINVDFIRNKITAPPKKKIKKNKKSLQKPKPL